MAIEISEITVHIPAVHRKPFMVIPTSAAEDQFLNLEYPWPIGIHVETPAAFRAIEDPVDQLRCAGLAALEAIKSNYPRFHKSKLDGKKVQSEGTTIVITSYDKDDTVIFATWDYGEPFDEAFARLAEIRRTLRLPEVTAKEYMGSTVEHLPPPQLIVSNVSAVGIDYPDTSLGNYGCFVPMIVAIGRKFIHLVVDHRLYMPKDEIIFINSFLKVFD